VEEDMETRPGSQPFSAEALAALGNPGSAYVKPVVHQGRPAYAICAADGSLLAVATSRQAAFGLIRQNDLDPLDAH
jgi:hypothetical protein